MLLHSQRRLRNGMPMSALPSRFLDEIPDELLSVEERTQSLRVFDEESVYQVDDGPNYRPGDRVRHHHFGTGRVHAVRQAGGATRVTVDFDRAGRRELSLTYAKLERI